jgi:uncharacterized membrane protein YeaQ/YmgE (transglycosylase-associated protein family)
MITTVISTAIVGAAAGFIASNIMKGRGSGLVKNLILGVVGAFVGSIIFWFIGFHAFGFIARILEATVGAVAVLFIAGALSKR